MAINHASTYAVALDIGTSGIRAQAMNAVDHTVVSSSMTISHPLPGSNVIDHVHFALEVGLQQASGLLVATINQVIEGLQIDINDIIRLSLCGNPFQLSVFLGIEIRDLAYAGKRKLSSLGVIAPTRQAVTLYARTIPKLKLPESTEIIVPPAVLHEIGADALALIIQTDMRRSDATSLATDYGTNAEIALCHKGRIYTGSTAAGPAIEGQQISHGVLACPGAIADLKPCSGYQRLIILNDEMLPTEGALIDISTGQIIENCSTIKPIGITGTGVIALVALAMNTGLISLPHISTPDKKLHLTQEIIFTEDDLYELGKAIGAIRAAHITLCQQAGIALKDIEHVYMAGASGTYVDPVKAQQLGMAPAQAKIITQMGNTSLAMARDLLFSAEQLKEMQILAEELKKNHCMFASSAIFKKVFILELSFWTEGMPLQTYEQFLHRYQLPGFSQQKVQACVDKRVIRDIAEFGELGLNTIYQLGNVSRTEIQNCTGCKSCETNCPGQALNIDTSGELPVVVLEQSLCRGMACRRCEQVCPENVFILNNLFDNTLKQDETKQ